MIYLLFWVSLSVLFYCYLGYGFLLIIFEAIRSLFRRDKKYIIPGQLPRITLIDSAFNEEAILEQKIRNCLDLEYPADLLSIIFVTDGSTDRSVEILKRFPRIKLLHQQERKGKYAAIKRAMAQVTTPLVAFSDANSILNKESIHRMAFHYQDEQVGGVAGEKKIQAARHLSVVGQAEGFYWTYESYMKKLDAGLHTVVGAAGELFSIRTNLFKVLDDDLILDDFVISMHVCLQGYKIEYEPSAFATESPSASLSEEEKRKTRISAGAYQSIGYLRACLNLFKHPVLTFQFISRRLIRWLLCPLMLVILLITNIIIVSGDAGTYFFSWFLYGQLAFYGLAILGGILVMTGRGIGILSIPFYFFFMNYCLVKGFFLFIRGRQTVLWEKSKRLAVEQ